jgi:hypothetical protein
LCGEEVHRSFASLRLARDWQLDTGNWQLIHA